MAGDPLGGSPVVGSPLRESLEPLRRGLLHRERADVEDLALTDILTHLPNRRHARVFLENEFGAAERGRLLSVVLFDLDSFKEYNDRYGHQAGDDGLRHFAEILASTARRMNLSSRFGGEEFLTVLAGSDEEGALVFAERVREALASLRLSSGSLTVSSGVATYHPSMRSPDELIAAARPLPSEAGRQKLRARLRSPARPRNRR
ncbi:MAG: GGDEF domain-containing protein [Gemmatimonadetes bacterium]|nr:GGDEF domain-containing protein [Gemmatimonadota bacterium]